MSTVPFLYLFLIIQLGAAVFAALYFQTDDQQTVFLFMATIVGIMLTVALYNLYERRHK